MGHKPPDTCLPLSSDIHVLAAKMPRIMWRKCMYWTGSAKTSTGLSPVSGWSSIRNTNIPSHNCFSVNQTVPWGLL